MDPKLEGFVWGLWVGVPVGWMLLALLSAAIDDRKARTREVES